MPASYDLLLWQGNNPPLVFRFRDASGLFALTDERFILTFTYRGTLILKKDTATGSEAFAIDTEASTLTWLPSVDETRVLPLGRHAKWELEKWKDDVQVTLLAGALIVSGGDNVDV
jgi:hypothetical protein